MSESDDFFAGFVDEHGKPCTAIKIGPERVPRWWTCTTHGAAMPHNAWGCPECVRELREEAASFHMAYRMKCDEETKAQAVEIDKLRYWVKQADERGDEALRRAHAAEATLETVGRIDYVGQALELEACAERSTSQTAERAMRRAAQTLRTVATFAQPVPPAPQEPA